MTTDHTSRGSLEDLRRSFETLGLQQKAEFVLEAAFATFATGIETAGRTLSRELDEMFAAANRRYDAHEPEHRAADEAAPGAAEAASPPPEDF